MGDLISRQAAIDEIKALYEWHEIVTEDRAIDHFKRLPSAEPERKSGKWIDDGWHGDWAWETDGHGNCWHLYRCSLCNTKVKARSNFCPNCGAKMEQEERK